jgi:non-ribosomal peptide synthetase component F
MARGTRKHTIDQKSVAKDVLKTKTVIAIYTGGTVGRLKGEPMWTVLKVKIKHGKGK